MNVASAPALPSATDIEVGQRLLDLLADQSRKVPVPVFGSLVVMALIAARHLPWWLPTAWLTVAATVLLVRRRWLRMLPLRRDIPLDRRLRIAAGLSLCNGIAHGLSLGAFPFVGEIERAFFSLFLLGLCSGAVGTTTGHRQIFLAYAIPAALPLPFLWALQSTRSAHWWIDLSVALLIALYFWLLVGLAQNAWATFEESVRIRFQQSDLNAQLQTALQRANEASQAKTRFLAAASHDLRQPLHTIGLLVAALSLRPIAGRDREIIDLLSQVTQALSEQLDQLLDISRLDAGVIQVERRLVAIDQLVRQYQAEARGSIEEKGLKAILKCDEPVHAYTDPVLLVRILRNLTENAIKFTESGFIAVESTVVGSNVVISVTDSGCGIAVPDQQKVFEEFYQVGNPERDRTRGLGLGLSIVHRLAELLEIKMTMTSQPGSGSRFELKLPLSFAPMPAPTAAGRSSGGSLNAKVLVIDDERSVRLGVRMLLEELGCTCTEAGNIQEAMLSAAVTRPDIVLADMRLRAGESGIAAINAIRAAIGPVPALLISGDTAPNRLQEAALAGIRMLHKPVSMDVLRSAIADATRPKDSP